MTALLMNLILIPRTVPSLRQCLRSLLVSLDQYYDDAWLRLNEQNDERDVSYVRNALMWVVHAQRPLEWKALQHTLLASDIKSNDSIHSF